MWLKDSRQKESDADDEDLDLEDSLEEQPLRAKKRQLTGRRVGFGDDAADAGASSVRFGSPPPDTPRAVSFAESDDSPHQATVNFIELEKSKPRTPAAAVDFLSDESAGARFTNTEPAGCVHLLLSTNFFPALCSSKC